MTVTPSLDLSADAVTVSKIAAVAKKLSQFLSRRAKVGPD